MAHKAIKESPKPTARMLKARTAQKVDKQRADRSRPARTERLNVRITPDEQALLTEGAGIEGVSVSAFVIKAARARARALLRRRRLIRLSDRDQRALIDALLSPPEPNAALVRAAASHAREAARRSTAESAR
ncbi:MAG TPA: DUF1778 domain-containing protein [Gemmatimonadaceae bacterium]